MDRRSFLKSLVALAAGNALPRWAWRGAASGYSFVAWEAFYRTAVLNTGWIARATSIELDD